MDAPRGSSQGDTGGGAGFNMCDTLDSCRSAVITSSHVTSHTSHVTRHKSQVTSHTSHVTGHKLHVTRHKLNVTRHKSHVTRHKSQTHDLLSRLLVSPRSSAERIALLQNLFALLVVMFLIK